MRYREDKVLLCGSRVTGVERVAERVVERYVVGAAWHVLISKTTFLEFQMCPSNTLAGASVWQPSLIEVFLDPSVSLINHGAIAANPDLRYQIVDGNVLWLFLLLTQAGSNGTAQWANLVVYLQNARWQFTGAA